MRKYFALLGAVYALGILVPSANAAITVPLGTYPSPTSSPYFYITSGTAQGMNLDATFGATSAAPNTLFDYLFTFHVPYNGTGSASLTTSFVGTPDVLISNVIINGMSYVPTMMTGFGQSLNVGAIPLTGLALDTIEVMGTNNATVGPFSGTLAYIALPGAVPEPATWASFLLGFGFMGLAVRRGFAIRLKTA